MALRNEEKQAEISLSISVIERTFANEGDNPKEKLPYPKAIKFLLAYKFFERFCVQGIKTLLVLYLISQLGFSEKSAMILYHVHCMIIFCTGILGAIISDSWLGQFRTILYTHLMSSAGMLLFVITVAGQLRVPFRSELTILAIIILSIGNGCSKPCHIAFGADQFQLPEQSTQVEQFFIKIYLILKLSGICASLLTPILRSDIPSVDPANGYLLAFGVTMVMDVISLAIYLSGIPFYKKETASGNILMQISKCIGSAIAGTWRQASYKTEKIHWLDNADAKHSQSLVNDTKILLNILVILVPISMFWALMEQTASLLPLQATRMNGDLGFYTVKPDQLQLILHLLVIACLPLCDLLVYPMLHSVGIRTVFQKITFAGVLAVIAFVAAGFLEMRIASASEKLHMIWILPQYLLLALVDAMVGVLGMVFANKAAPPGLRTVIQASFLATHALGNLYDVVVFSACSFSNQAYIFFLFGALMIFNILLFIVLIKRYEPAVPMERNVK